MPQALSTYLAVLDMQLCSVVLALGIVGCVWAHGGYWWLGRGAFGGQEDIQGVATLVGGAGLMITQEMCITPFCQALAGQCCLLVFSLNGIVCPQSC